MRFKNILGLLAIGGAVAYAQKKRGRDLSVAGLKETFNEVAGGLKSRLGEMRGGSAGSVAESSSMGAAGAEDSAYSSGFAGSDYSGRGGSTFRQ